VKPPGPVHAYVAPLTTGVLSVIVPVSQNGPTLDAAGVVGIAFTTTFVVPASEVQPSTVMVTEYVPAIASVALLRVGSRSDDTKPEGPVHA
jgi:hypothetical protein